MSDGNLDELAEAARNRGLKLVRSRVRTPGRRRFGNVGLTDKSRKPVFGMDAKGPTAKPAEVQAYLRKLDARDWGASLDVAAPQRKRTGKKLPGRAPAPANDAPARRPKPAPKPKPVPEPNVRAARAADAPALVELIALLGHKVDAKGVRKRTAALDKAGLAPLVAVVGKKVVGLCGIDIMIAVHRDQPVGRINILVVAEETRGKGIGRLLASAAEEHLRKKGCGIVEVTSNDRLTSAHAFYRHMGFERTSIRFAKTL